jgi:hypothetical protein
MTDWYSPPDAAAVIEEFCRAKGWQEAMFCQAFGLGSPYSGRVGWISRLRKGKVASASVSHVIARCAANWPDGAEWPPYVVRPRGDDDGESTSEESTD